MIRLIIADDHTLFRIGLRQMLHTFPGVEVVRETTNAEDTLTAALAANADHSADILLTDLTMPGTSGTRLIEQIHMRCTNLPMLVLSMHDEPAMVRRALKAGAIGYITKESTPAILQCAIKNVASGTRYVAPTLVSALNTATDTGDHSGNLSGLSPREAEVLKLILAGISLNQIAEQLCISPKTITTHKTHLMEKLGVDNNADLIRYALEHRLFE